jgi:hypothetical protein
MLSSWKKKIINRKAEKLWKKDKGRRFISYRAVHAIVLIKHVNM